MGNQTEETAWNQLIKGFQYYAKEAWISFCNCGHNELKWRNEKCSVLRLFWQKWFGRTDVDGD